MDLYTFLKRRNKINDYKFLGTIIYFNENKIVVIPPEDYLVIILPRRKLKNADLKIGSEVYATETEKGYKLDYLFKKPKPGEEEKLEQLRDQYLEFHKKE